VSPVSVHAVGRLVEVAAGRLCIPCARAISPNVVCSSGTKFGVPSWFHSVSASSRRADAAASSPAALASPASTVKLLRDHLVVAQIPSQRVALVGQCLRGAPVPVLESNTRQRVRQRGDHAVVAFDARQA